MRRGRFTEDQIIGVLREHEAGVKTAELCRKHGISDATFYNSKAKYGGMTMSDNGAELVSRATLGFCEEIAHRVALHRAGQADPERLRERPIAVDVRHPVP